MSGGALCTLLLVIDMISHVRGVTSLPNMEMGEAITLVHLRKVFTVSQTDSDEHSKLQRLTFRWGAHTRPLPTQHLSQVLQ